MTATRATLPVLPHIGSGGFRVPDRLLDLASPRCLPGTVGAPTAQDHGDRHPINPASCDFYTRLYRRGKLRKVASVAAMRKLSFILNAVVWDALPCVHSWRGLTLYTVAEQT